MIANFFKIFLTTLIVALFISSSTVVKSNGSHKELDKIFSLYENGEALFIDSRDSEHYELSHVDGALNIPFHMENKISYFIKMEDLIESMPYVVIYCDGSECNLSEMLAKELVEYGISKDKIIIFKEGFETWKKAGYPVSSDTEFQKALLES